jgi:hypothetical protein
MHRPLLPLALLAVVLAAPADAQRRRDRDDGWFARKGDAALTFSIDALTVGPVEGGVGGRLWLSDRVAAAASLGFGYARLDGGSYAEDVEAFSTSFSVGFERHVGRSRRVSPFLGLRAEVGHALFEYDDVYYAEPPLYPCMPEGECPVPESYYGGFTRTVSETRLGAAGVLGAEVRVVEDVTLMLAHSLGLTYTRGDVDSPVVPDGPWPPGCDGCEGGPRDVYPGYRPDYSRVEVGTGTTALTLSVYF